MHHVSQSKTEARDPSLPWLSPVVQRILWVALVVLAGVDAFHPITVLHEMWWIVFFVLWTLRSRDLVEPMAFWGQVALWLSAILLFAWIVERLQIGTLYSVRTWMLFQSTPGWSLLTYPMHITLAAIVVGVLTIATLRRVVGDAAAAPIGVLACIPLECQLLNYLFYPSAKALVIPIRLFQVAMPILVTAEAASLFARISAPTAFVASKRRVRQILWAILDGRGGLVASGGFYVAGGLMVIAIMRWWIQAPGDAHSCISMTLHLALFVMTLFGVIGAGIATWWKLGRMNQRPMEANPVAILGKILVAGSACVLLVFLMFTMPRIAHALTHSLRGQEWSISLTRRPGGLRLAGTIQMGISHALESQVIKFPNVYFVELASPGGNVREGLAMAATVKKYELSTYVKQGQECDSACTLAFVAGRHRLLGPGALLGFHREISYFWDGRSDDDQSNERMAAYLTSNGVAAAFARKVVSVPAANIWYPSTKELVAAGVITGTTPPEARHE